MNIVNKTCKFLFKDLHVFNGSLDQYPVKTKRPPPSCLVYKIEEEIIVPLSMIVSNVSLSNQKSNDPFLNMVLHSTQKYDHIYIS